MVPGDVCHNCGRLDVIISTCPRCSEAYVLWCKMRNCNSFVTHEREAAEVVAVKPTEAETTEAQAAKAQALVAVATATLIDFDTSLHEHLRSLDILESKAHCPTSKLPAYLFDNYVPVLKVSPLKARKLAVDDSDSPNLPPEAQNVLQNVHEQLEKFKLFPHRRKTFLHHLKSLLEVEKLN